VKDITSFPQRTRYRSVVAWPPAGPCCRGRDPCRRDERSIGGSGSCSRAVSWRPSSICEAAAT